GRGRQAGGEHHERPRFGRWAHRGRAEGEYRAAHKEAAAAGVPERHERCRSVARQVRRKQRQARAVAIGESREHAAHREESGERTRNRGGNDKRRRVEIEAAAEEDVEFRACDRLTPWKG